MRYMIALFCPPLAMVRSGKPGRALAVIGLLILAAITWSTGLGAIPAAFAMLWAIRTVGELEADEELAGFLRLFNAADPRQP
jgi:hypothetical protein